MEWNGFSAQPAWYEVGCRCTSDGGKKAWVQSQDPNVWVHMACEQPSPAVLEANVLNLFRWGPHHNDIVDTKTLMSSSDYAWIAEYKWTPEIVVGSETGRQARVWIHKDRVPSSSTAS